MSRHLGKFGSGSNPAWKPIQALQREDNTGPCSLKLCRERPPEEAGGSHCRPTKRPNECRKTGASTQAFCTSSNCPLLFQAQFSRFVCKLLRALLGLPFSVELVTLKGFLKEYL